MAAGLLARFQFEHLSGLDGGQLISLLQYPKLENHGGGRRGKPPATRGTPARSLPASLVSIVAGHASERDVSQVARVRAQPQGF